jgi:hypothetical protein
LPARAEAVPLAAGGQQPVRPSHQQRSERLHTPTVS